MTAIRLAGGFATTREAERHADVAGHRFVATTFDPADRVVVVGADDAGSLPERARLFVFPGHEQLTGAVPVVALLAAVDEVRGLGGADVDHDALVRTQEFVRPLVEGGRVVLTVRPFDDGTGAAYVPFEQPNPTPCCVDH